MANVALPIADGFLFTMPLAVATDGGKGMPPSTAPSTTRLSEIIQQTPIVTPQHLTTLAVH
jgi:hypothetical protein